MDTHGWLVCGQQSARHSLCGFRTFSSFLAALLLSFSSTYAFAEVVTYRFTASSGAGTAAGTFGYDTSVADSTPGNASIGTYPGSGFVKATINGGPDNGLVIQESALEWFVENGDQDVLAVLAPVNINLTDESGEVFDSTEFPTDLSLDDFDEAEIVVNGIFYEFTSLVRVPTTTALNIYVIDAGVILNSNEEQEIIERLVEHGHNVTSGDALSDYSGFDQVWDVRFDKPGAVFPPAEIAAIQAYLAGGGRMMIIGENTSANFDDRNAAIADLLFQLGAGSINVLNFSTSTFSDQAVTEKGDDLFNIPNEFERLPTIASGVAEFTAPMGPDTGFPISELFDDEEGTGQGTYLGWDFGSISTAPGARLIVSFDVNPFDEFLNPPPMGAPALFPWQLQNARDFTENAVNFLATGEFTEAVEVTVDPPPVGVPNTPVLDPGEAGNEDLIYSSAAALVVQADTLDTLFCIAPDPRFVNGVFTPRTLNISELAGLGTCPNPLTVGNNGPGSVPDLDIPPYARGFPDLSGEEQIAIGLVDAGDTVFQGVVQQIEEYERLAGFQPTCDTNDVSQIPFTLDAPIESFGETPNPEGSKMLSSSYTCQRARSLKFQYSGQAFYMRLDTTVLSPVSYVLNQVAGLTTLIARTSCIARSFRTSIFRDASRARVYLGRQGMEGLAIQKYEDITLRTLLELEKTSPELGAFNGCIDGGLGFDPENVAGKIATRSLVIAGSAAEFLVNGPDPYEPPPDILSRLPEVPEE